MPQPVVDVELIIYRLIATSALAALLVAMVACLYPGTAVFLFLPVWAALFFGWQHLGRKQKLNIPKAPQPTCHPKRATAWGRLIITGLAAYGIAFGIALTPVGDVSAVAGLLIWIALYYGWPPLSRRLPVPEWLKPKVQPVDTLPAHGYWQVVGRGALAMFGVCTVMIVLPGILFMPIGHSMVRARRIHDSIHVGMTVPEVLNASRDCDFFGASSEFPYEKKEAGDNVPTMNLTNLSRDRDGMYQTYDLVAQRNISMTETQAVERLRAKLHDGYRWRFTYTYSNIFPMTVSFSVIFSPDGRVIEVTPVQGRD